MIRLELLERRLNYQFKNKALFKQALTHKSSNHLHNERLEFLGDAILNFIIADLLFQEFKDATEGELTRARASLVNKAALFEIAQTFSLGEFLYLGIGEQRSGGFRRESILADALEAIIGAIYLDAGLKVIYQCIQRWYADKMAVLTPHAQEKDPKTRLQEWLQANQKALPLYQVISIKGEPHSQIFTVSCEIPELSLVIEGEGSSRRIAEQIAARKTLEVICKLPN